MNRQTSIKISIKYRIIGRVPIAIGFQDSTIFQAQLQKPYSRGRIKEVEDARAILLETNTTFQKVVLAAQNSQSATQLHHVQWKSYNLIKLEKRRSGENWGSTNARTRIEKVLTQKLVTNDKNLMRNPISKWIHLITISVICYIKDKITKMKK